MSVAQEAIRRLKMQEPPALSKSSLGHFSVNKVNTYRKCPAQFKYKYIDALPSKNNANFVLGSAADAAITVAIKQLRTIGDFDWELIHQSFTNYMLDDIGKSPELDSEDLEVITQGSAVLHDALDQYLFYMKNNFVEFLEPQIKISDWYVDRDCNYPLLGFIDMVAINHDGKYVVVDHKTKKDARVSHDYRFQILTYCLWVKEHFNLNYLPKAEIHILLKVGQKKDPSLYRIKEIFYTKEQINSVRNDYYYLEEGIAKDYFPKNRWHDLCQKKFCDFYDHCHSD